VRCLGRTEEQVDIQAQRAARLLQRWHWHWHWQRHDVVVTFLCSPSAYAIGFDDGAPSGEAAKLELGSGLLEKLDSTCPCGAHCSLTHTLLTCQGHRVAHWRPLSNVFPESRPAVQPSRPQLFVRGWRCAALPSSTLPALWCRDPSQRWQARRAWPRAVAAAARTAWLTA